MDIVRTCPLCGQGKFPFKKGICFVCGEQTWEISYINPNQHQKPISYKTEKSGIDSLFSKLYDSECEYADC